MRVLVLSQFFTPEVVAAATRVQSFVDALQSAGHAVDVVCEVPNHPDGVVAPEYRGRALTVRRDGGARIWYVPVRASPVKTPASRLAFYGSYALSATALAMAVPCADVVLGSSPPLPVGVAAAAAAARHRAPWILDVRDLWPDAAVALGELSGPRLIRLAERLERRLYSGAEAITTVTPAFRDAIASRVGRPGKVSLVPNGASELCLQAAGWEPDRGALDLASDRFVWTYAGNVGLAQGLDSAVHAAARLGTGFQLVVLGGGPERERLERLAAGLPVGSVVFRDTVPQSLAARYLRASDALLVPLADTATLRSFVPSKLFDCCAVQRPVILAADGQARRLPGIGRAALPVAPGDPQALAGAVRRLRDDAELRRALGSAGAAFAAQHSRERQAGRLVELVEGVAARQRRSGRRGTSASRKVARRRHSPSRLERRASSRPAAVRRSRKRRSAATRSISPAAAGASPGGTSSAASPTASAMPPTAVATTGRPAAKAS